jgi:cobalt/nickel transport protein
MEKRYLKAFLVIIILFAIGLVGYFAFSAMYGDGLEKTMQDGGISEGTPVYNAPLSYGDGYGGALFAGIIGFALVFGALFLYLKISKARRQRN